MAGLLDLANGDMGGLLGSDPSTLGLSLMAAAGPSPVRQPIGAVLGNAGIAAQRQTAALTDAQIKRFQLAMMARQFPIQSQILQGLANRMNGGGQGMVAGQPQETATPQQVAGYSASAAPQGAPSAGPSSDGMSNLEVGAYGPLAGLDTKGFTELGKAQLQYDPAVATRVEAAKSALAVDMQQIREATAQGNMDLARALYNGKFQQDLGLLHLSSMGGIQTRIDPRTGQISTLNPSSGIETQGNQASLMPGMAQAIQAKAQAEAGGQAAYEPMTLQDPNTGIEYPVPRSVLGGGMRAPQQQASGPMSGGGQQPTASPAMGPLVSGIGPSRTAMLHGLAEQAVENNKEYQAQADAGQQMLVQTNELRQAAHDFTPGKFAESRMNALQYLSAANLITPDQAKSLGSAQAGQKIAIQLQAAATKQLGSREAAQIFQIMGKSLPNLTLSQNGLDKVSGYMDGIARYNIARAQAASDRAAKGDANGVNNVRNEFIQNTNPAYFVIASSPPAIQKEIIQSMGAQAPKFLKDWNAAANNNWAPRPNQYWGANAP